MFYELIRALLPHLGGLTEEAVRELEDAIEKHQAEHEAVVASMNSAGHAAAAPETPPASVTEGVTS